jgi:hypothetical protein
MVRIKVGDHGSDLEIEISGSIIEYTSELSVAINAIYTGIENPDMREIFRGVIQNRVSNLYGGFLNFKGGISEKVVL